MRKVIFVADYFLHEFQGGAELTSQALIDICPMDYLLISAKTVSRELIKQHSDCFWVFFNYSKMKYALCDYIAETLNYAIVEYDYKYCVYRSPDLHKFRETINCNCRNYFLNKFFLNAKKVWFMSERQMEWHKSKIKGLDESRIDVLSSVFNESTLAQLSILATNKERKGWAVVYSGSVIKGFEQSEEYCKANNIDYKVLRNLKYSEILKELSLCKGLVYMPMGGDTCPRLVIEAKLLGCELILNDFVEHKNETWFENIDLCKWHLSRNKEVFWREIKSYVDQEISL